jgi:plasmid stabilization system protein ParE
MKFRVVTLRRAEADIRHITFWLAERSVSGAFSWLDAYEDLLDRLVQSADTCPAALEAAQCKIPLKQALFGTRRGRIYRAVFTIAGNQVRILRIRGPGQSPLQEDELL